MSATTIVRTANGPWHRRGLLLAGLAANALGVAVVTEAHLGTSPIAAIPYGLSLVVPGLTLGEWTIVFGLALTAVQIVIDPAEPDWRSLGIQTVLGFVFGYAIDVFVPVARLLSPAGYAPKVVMLLGGCLVIAVGAFLEVMANLAMLPGDAFIRALCRRFDARFGKVRVISDVTMSVTGAAVCWIFLGSLGSVREGTVISAIAVGLMIHGLARMRTMAKSL
ncbi:DUF6198 family protein [uncultured Bifidobacterium sp.]|uniref:YczE/YyaS/YitT family protein n=1 Tax=uncultured Bifidobacterium sp. TaxID=165187 RepID=UPI002631A2C1|nr:DUF6198 family protein [uncultured Bifidobacterium sp.]